MDRSSGSSPSKPEKPHPLRVLIVAGSNRRQYNCPGVDSKARALMLRMADRMPSEWHVDVEDLSNVYGREQIRSCNACVSTAMALCVWPCNCYEANSKKEPDLLWNLDLYSRLDQADAWAFIGPVNWYAPTSTLKLLFDRLVCMNGGNPREDLIDHKDPEMAMELEHSEKWAELSVNHLEGRSAAFFSYGDGGGDEIDATGRPKILRHPAYFPADAEPFRDMRDAYAPLVWQCRYGGIEVPDRLWQYREIGRGKKYSDSQAENMAADESFMKSFDHWADDFAQFTEAKGKIEPGRYRAFGYRPPRHLTADVKLFYRALRMALGRAPADSSPRKQHDAGLNRDASLKIKDSERQRYRRKS